MTTPPTLSPEEFADRALYVRSLAIRLHEIGFPPPNAILGRTRRLTACEARSLICWFLRQQKWTHTMIGEIIGRHHSSVIASERQIAIRIEVYAELRAAVAQLPLYRTPIENPSAPLARPQYQSLDMLRLRRSVLEAELGVINACISNIVGPDVHTRVAERVA